LTEPQRLHPAACPTCQRPYPLEAPQHRPLTEREVDMLSAWYHYRSVKLAAVLIGVGEQRAKNLLASARSKGGVQTNPELVEKYLGQLRSVQALIAERRNSIR
jgi:DNA-binding CsgD family transcriptional regulator